MAAPQVLPGPAGRPSPTTATAATAALAATALTDRSSLDTGLARPAVAAACVAVVVGVLAAGRWAQQAEAAVSAAVARAVGIPDAHRVGSTVLFDLDGRAVGHAVTLGGTAVLPLVPLLLVTGAVLTVRRASTARALAALGAAAAVVVAADQVRLLAALAGIRLLGPEGGAATHPLVDTALSAVGVIGAALLLLAVLTRSPRGRGAGGARRG